MLLDVLSNFSWKLAHFKRYNFPGCHVVTFSVWNAVFGELFELRKQESYLNKINIASDYLSGLYLSSFYSADFLGNLI